MSRAGREAERRRRARARKANRETPAPAPPVRPHAGVPEWWAEHCPDPENHKVCPDGSEHDWYKPHPRPRDHKYQCEACGHYDLDDYM